MDFHENSGLEETLKVENSYVFHLFKLVSLPIVNLIQWLSKCPEGRAPGPVKALFAEHHERLI